MKRPVVVVALILAMASPASAAAAKKKRPVHGVRTSTLQARPALASDPYSVYVGGEYIGRDPDPNIRAFMARNPHIWDGPE